MIFACFGLACSGQSEKNPSEVMQLSSTQIAAPDQQIASYIRNLHQDQKGNFWMGTNSLGVAHFNGNEITYYSVEHGFNGRQVSGITEDVNHNLWFSTNMGVVMYDSQTKQFINYTDSVHFEGKRFWSIFADSENNIWAGSASGVYLFSEGKWNEFSLPYPSIYKDDFIGEATTWSITQDRKGNMWFSTNGYGAFMFDGENFTQFTTVNGLADNSVDVITEDQKGNIWLGTRYGGISCYNGLTFINFSQKDSIGNDEVCEVFSDSTGNVWFSSEGYGVYCFDGKRLKNYGTKEGLGVTAVQSIFEDRKGRIWVGGGGGLYRLEGDSFINIKKGGPWD